MKIPHCSGNKTGENTGFLNHNVKVCYDARKYNEEKGECPFLRLIDIGHVHCPVCIYEIPTVDSSNTDTK